MNSRPVRNPVSKEVDSLPEDVASGGPTYMHIHACTHMHTQSLLKDIKKAISNELSGEVITSFEICTALSVMVRRHYENPLIPRIQRTGITSTDSHTSFL